MTEDVQQIKKWVGIWVATAVSLKEIKKKELQAPGYYDKNRQMLDEMLQYAFQHAKPRLKSGLVEQQHLFMKLRNKKKEDHK
jgi:hypothetical protein